MGREIIFAICVIRNGRIFAWGFVVLCNYYTVYFSHFIFAKQENLTFHILVVAKKF